MFSLLIILCIGKSVSYSNNAPLIMKGDTAFPINSDNIKLESEVIKIHYGKFIHDIYGGMEHEVEVIFNFVNTGKETELDIGFPNTANWGEKLKGFEAYDYPSMVQYETEIKMGSTLPGHDIYMYNTMHSWNMNFKENEKKSLYVKYRFYGSSGIQGADYILVTGALWKDRIEKIDVYVDFPKPAAYTQISATPKNYYYNGEGIEWHFNNVEPDFNLLVKHTEYPSTFEFESKHYEPRNYNPHDDYLWDDGYFWIDTYVEIADMLRLPLHEVRDIDKLRSIVKGLKETNQCVVNEIYARNGYTFETEKWRDIFLEASWYVKNPEFSIDKLNSTEKRNISHIKQFDNTVITDGTDEELVNSIKEFTEKYNDKDIVSWTEVVSKYYQYNYEFLKQEKDRIKKNKALNKFTVDLSDGTYELDNNSMDKSGIAPKGDNPIRTHEIPGSRKIKLYENGFFVEDSKGGTKCLLEYSPFQRKESSNTNNSIIYPNNPNIKDVLEVSTNGNYMLVGTDYGLEEYSDIVGNQIYMASTQKNSTFLLGEGSFKDYRFWWSPSENILCYQNHKKEPGYIRILDINNETFEKYNLPDEAVEIKDIIITDEKSIAVQSKDKVFDIYTKNKEDEIKYIKGTIMNHTNESIYLYEGSSIYKASWDDFKPQFVNEIGSSIWSSEKISNELYLIYAGGYNLFIYNEKENQVYEYGDLGQCEILKPSPMGDRVFVQRNYYDLYNLNELNGGFIIESGSGGSIRLDGERNGVEWIDNENLIVSITIRGSGQLIKYKYNPFTNERKLIESGSKRFTSFAVERLGYGLMENEYDINNYGYEKYEIKSNGYIVKDNTTIYRNSKMTDIYVGVLEKGSLVGVLEQGGDISRILFFNDKNSINEGFISSEDYTTSKDIVEPKKGFVLGAKVYEKDGEEFKLIFESCSSEVKILEKDKSGWAYINAADSVYGWVKEQEIEYGFRLSSTEVNTDEGDLSTPSPQAIPTVIDEGIETETEMQEVDEADSNIEKDESEGRKDALPWGVLPLTTITLAAVGYAAIRIIKARPKL